MQLSFVHKAGLEWKTTVVLTVSWSP